MSTAIIKREPGELAPQSGGEVAQLISLAIERGLSPEALEKLVALKERVDAREAKREFDAAFARLQTKLPRVRKDGKIDLGKGKPIPFARWEDVDRAIRPILAEEGFALSFTSAGVQGSAQMTAHLKHTSGHEETSVMVLPPDAGPGRNALQAIGSSHSYGKRYLATDILNIITEGVDDDGTKACPLIDDEYQRVRNMLDEIGLNDGAMRNFLRFAGAPSVELIQRHRFEEVMQALRDKLRAKREGR